MTAMLAIRRSIIGDSQRLDNSNIISGFDKGHPLCIYPYNFKPTIKPNRKACLSNVFRRSYHTKHTRLKLTPRSREVSKRLQSFPGFLTTNRKRVENLSNLCKKDETLQCSTNGNINMATTNNGINMSLSFPFPPDLQNLSYD